MGFLVHQLGQFVMVLVVMICALFGTVGIIKLIKKLFPFIDLPQNLYRADEKDENSHNNAEGKSKK